MTATPFRQVDDETRDANGHGEAPERSGHGVVAEPVEQDGHGGTRHGLRLLLAVVAVLVAGLAVTVAWQLGGWRLPEPEFVLPATSPPVATAAARPDEPASAPAPVGAGAAREKRAPRAETKPALASRADERAASLQGLARQVAPAAPAPAEPVTALMPSAPHPASVAEPEPGGGAEGGVSSGIAFGGPPEPGPLYAPMRPGSRPSAPSGLPPSTGGTTEPNDQPYGDVFFREYGVNPFIDTEDDNLSTFGLEVDTGSYTVVRRYLDDGNLPPREAVRVEEMLNAFDYGDPPPRRGDFALYAEAAPTPFGEGQRYAVLRFGIKGRVIDESRRKPAVLVFVVDTSGSMAAENRLEAVKWALAELLGQLRPDDRVGLVQYGSSGHVLVEPTGDLAAVGQALRRLHPDGATNAEEGLRLGYQLASRYFREHANNRVILCSDGVANVGRTGPESILEQIRRDAARGIELTTVGFGMGNFNDVLLEQLADAGDGRYAYVDTPAEARRLFVAELTGTLESIARDARVQVDFDPQVVTRYRLLGYENRDIADERFRDDTVDAGEIGAGHSVTALYELKLAEHLSRRDTLATLHLRYKTVEGEEWVEQELRVTAGDLAPSWDEASPALRLASLVAEYGELLKGSHWSKRGDLTDVVRRLKQLLRADLAGDPKVTELASLAERAVVLRQQKTLG